jgi:hypothetical protein
MKREFVSINHELNEKDDYKVRYFQANRDAILFEHRRTATIKNIELNINRLLTRKRLTLICFVLGMQNLFDRFLAHRKETKHAMMRMLAAKKLQIRLTNMYKRRG